MAQPQIEANIQDLGNILYVVAPFDEQLMLLEQKHSRLISARDLAYARIQDANTNTAQKSSLCQNGSYVREGSLYLPKAKHKIVLVRNSLCLKHPKEATQAHREAKDFFVDEKEVEEYVKKMDSLVLKNTDVLKCTAAVPSNRFAEDEMTVWLFQDQAKDYGLLLQSNNITKMPFHFNSQESIVSQKKPYADQLLLERFLSASAVDSNDHNLSYEDDGYLGYGTGVRGLQYNAEGVKVGELPKSRLEKIVSPLHKL